jgi:hypothetical protein
MEDEMNDALVDALALEMKKLFEGIDSTNCLSATIVITAYLIQKYSPDDQHEAVTDKFCSLLRQTLEFKTPPPKAAN